MNAAIPSHECQIGYGNFVPYEIMLLCKDRIEDPNNSVNLLSQLASIDKQRPRIVYLLLEPFHCRWQFLRVNTSKIASLSEIGVLEGVQPSNHDLQ